VGALLAGIATGVGSLPDTDIEAALAETFDALPDLPYLPELPGRGPGSDMIGRTAAQLAGLGVDRTPSGWRLVDRPGLDQRAARERLEADLDALLPVAGPGYDGALKLQLTGPWTLAAALDLPRGGAVLGDAGAVRDLVASLAETAREHLADVRRRVPAANLVLQLDEPSLVVSARYACRGSPTSSRPCETWSAPPTCRSWCTAAAPDRRCGCFDRQAPSPSEST
jgi:hypothetical protein